MAREGAVGDREVHDLMVQEQGAQAEYVCLNGTSTKATQQQSLLRGGEGMDRGISEERVRLRIPVRSREAGGRWQDLLQIFRKYGEF